LYVFFSWVVVTGWVLSTWVGGGAGGGAGPQNEKFILTSQFRFWVLSVNTIKFGLNIATYVFYPKKYITNWRVRLTIHGLLKLRKYSLFSVTQHCPYICAHGLDVTCKMTCPCTGDSGWPKVDNSRGMLTKCLTSYINTEWNVLHLSIRTISRTF